MDNIGKIEFKGKALPIQTEGRQVYVGGCPVEQWPRELRERVGDVVRDAEK